MDLIRGTLKPALIFLAALAAFYFLFLRRPSEKTTVESPSVGADGGTGTAKTYEIVTLLPRDAIPAIFNPRFYSAAEADAEYEPTERVLGVSINGESRAYSTSYLDRHEIVNDTVGGRKIAVTW